MLFVNVAGSASRNGLLVGCAFRGIGATRIYCHIDRGMRVFWSCFGRIEYLSRGSIVLPVGVSVVVKRGR